MMSIIYENKEILVVNKPSGLAVQPGKNLTNSVIQILKKERGDDAYLIHRLDKETSGGLLVAKTQNAAQKFTKLFSSKTVKKTYWAICYGIPEEKEGTITDPIFQDGIWKSAESHYTVLKTFDDKYSLVSVVLGTGRMHQIRIHMAGIKCPVIGDDKHGNFLANKEVKKNIGIKKMLLHAKQLVIPTNNIIDIPQPEYFDKFEEFFKP